MTTSRKSSRFIRDLRGLLAIAAFLLVCAPAVVSVAQESNRPLPLDWHGTWRGNIEVVAEGKTMHRAEMELRIEPLESESRLSWIQTYSGQPPRAYVLRTADGGTGRLVMDEQNGILLDAQLSGGTLHSTFRTGDVLLSSRFEKQGHELSVEIATFHDALESERPASKVASLPFRSVQRGVLHRQRPAEALPKLAPDSAITFTFPELPNTLSGMASGRTEVPQLRAILPKNFSPGSKHPLFIYLKGGSGGPDDGGAMARDIIGDQDFIAVHMPLFKKSQPKGRTLPVALEDFAIISPAYRAMLEKLAASVPNIDWDRSVIGGHSNGAHTLGVLLAGRDEFLSRHFRTFWFHEGGFTLFPAYLQHKESRFLALIADDATARTSEFRQIMLEQMALTGRQAKVMGTDFRLVTMRGYGHDVPPEYMRNVRQFSRREPLEDIVTTQVKTAAGLTLPLRTHPDATSWNDLLVLDLTNMKAPGAVWSYRHGILSATADQNIWTKATHGDCVLDFEFKLESGANGGVFLYNSDEDNWTSSSIEIQLCDDASPQWSEKPASWHCGAFFGRQAPRKSTVRAAGAWNRITLTSQGPKITVVLNGEVVNEFDLTRWSSGKTNPDGSPMPEWLQGRPWSVMPHRGRIGFQGRHAGAGIEYRNIKLLRL